MNFLFVLSVISCVILSADGARILALFPHRTKSHYNVFEPLLKKLAEKGHQVVSVSSFPQKRPLANFTDIDVSSCLPSFVGTRAVPGSFKPSKWVRLRGVLSFGTSTCDPVLNYPALKRLVRSEEKFDAYIVELFNTECFLGIVHALNIPVVIGATSSVTLPWTSDIVRTPEIPSYIPNWISSLTDRMSFFERSANFLDFLLTKFAYRYLSDKPGYEIAKKHFGDDLPDFDALRAKISLILTNGHAAVNTPRALAPGLKELGGIHIPASGPPALPADLQHFLDSHGENGVIYFSLGSQIDSSTMAAQALAGFYRAFEQVPQQILWKCSAEKMPTLPRNVKCIEWAPQLAILCHPNVRLFITHGGLLGSQEAVYCGVPLLGIPLYGDQHLNVAYFVKKGLALSLDYRQLSYELISNALNELLLNKSYTDAAGEASSRFRDRPIPPLDEGVYWVEYLLRHGPDSLKIAAADLTWYQYLLLDVVSAMVVSTLVAIWTVCKLLRLLFRRRETISVNVDKKRS
ncbi:hypothetical protein K0M31_007994 [Melipona bicolor]|uniref:UDP-glucuronosyltransferase n=1 Tax=Melipona bicolor TaxID=60889 RepID=A0AA40KWJ3_9HYME|nr:hypothetical protein K0M31_007994 [Melipona bicolor]